MVTFRSNSDRKMASRLSLTEVLKAVLDDDSVDFDLSEDESSEGEDEGISAYAGQHYMNPEEVASLGGVVEVSNTTKQLRKAEIVCKIIKIDFSMGLQCTL